MLTIEVSPKLEIDTVTAVTGVCVPVGNVQIYLDLQARTGPGKCIAAGCVRCICTERKTLRMRAASRDEIVER